MAKIQQEAQRNAEHNKTSSPSTQPEAATPKISIKPENPFKQLQASAQDQSRPAVNITPAKRDSTSQTRASSQSTPQDSLETWEHKTLCDIFRLSLAESRTHDVHGNRLFYVAGVRSELDEAGSAPRIHTSLLDQAMLEAASLQDHKPLEYLIPCWKRVSRALRNTRSDVKDDPKVGTLKEARRLCMSYAIFAITMPEMFGHEVDPVASFAPHLLLDMDNEKSIDHDFLSEACARFADDETIKDALVRAMEHVSKELSSLSMNDNYKPHIMVSRREYSPLSLQKLMSHCRPCAILPATSPLSKPWLPRQSSVPLAFPLAASKHTLYSAPSSAYRPCSLT